MRLTLHWMSGLALAAFAVQALAANPPASITCWTDANGVRNCGDRVPPEAVRGERQVIDEHGRVVDTKARERTPEELAEDARRAQVAAEEKRRADARSRYDKYLLQTYPTLADLVRARDQRLLNIDSRLALARKGVSEADIGVNSLTVNIEKTKAEGKTPHARILEQLRIYQQTLRDNRRALLGIEKERIDAVTKFESDIARYRELRPEEAVADIAPPSEAPPEVAPFDPNNLMTAPATAGADPMVDP